VRLTSSAQHDGGAAWGPDGLTIAFRRGEVGSADLAEVSASGGGFRWLARTSAFDRGPEWSPDGKTLVFASNRTGNWEIHTIDRSTLAVRNLTHNSAADLAPAWSTDGRRIVFGSNRTGNYELHSMNADGTRVRRLTQDPGDDAHPDWSPDGRKICYRWTDGSRAELRVINANGSGVRTLVGSPYEVQCTAWIVRGSQRVLVGAAGADAGYDPPLGPKRKAVLVIHDDHSIRSVVGIHSAGGAPVFLAMRPGGAIRATCQNAVSVVESWWMGEPAQWRLRRGQNSGHCRIVYDPRTGRVGRVAVVQ